jgi:tetratricopeptide (TPR) repeat protein
MKKYYFTLIILFAACLAFAQPAGKQKQKSPAQSEMDKAMEDAMKDMSEEEKAEMKKMMKGVMPEMTAMSTNAARYPDFNSNKELVPKKDIARINTITKKALTQADIAGYAGGLYNKLLTKGDAAEMALVKKIIAQAPKANDIGGAAILCMMQGHPQAAMALSMKSAQLEPANSNWQNNMASLLTQYGYPEQAIPLLDKLKREFPHNSTVLNNLGQAWFSLGELDSAKKFTGLAIRANPFHPEAKVCGGLIEELKGDPIKAAKEYTEAMENAPNPVIEKILKNATGGKGLENIDFEKFKKSIAIHEYFPKDWIKIPVLSDNVSGFENDMKIKNGYAKMFAGLEDRLDTMKEASETEINKLLEKSENEFATEMMKESIKGLNVMSRTAVTVQMVLQTFVAKWLQDDLKEHMELESMISAKRTEMTKAGKDDKCPDYDRKNTEFLKYINPLIREYHAKKIETFRTWLNAYCTWVWYIAGNPKNTVMSMCIGWTIALTDLYKSAVHDQKAIEKSCVKQNNEAETFVAAPIIPDFSCPATIKLPLGKDWLEISNATANFDAASLGIKQTGTPVPNTSIAYGGGTGSIAQAGSSPFSKMAAGSMSTSNTSVEAAQDRGLLKALKKTNQRNGIKPAPTDAQIVEAINNRLSGLLAKSVMKKYLATECNKKPKPPKPAKPPKFEVGLGKLIMYPTDAEVVYVEDYMAVLLADGSAIYYYDDGREVKYPPMIFGLGELTMEEIDRGNDHKPDIIVEPAGAKDDLNLKDKIINAIDKMVKSIEDFGLQSSLNSGVQTPGTFTPLKDLFK